MTSRVFLQTMIALASASLGLVAALAWNEAIKATLALRGLGDSLVGLYTRRPFWQRVLPSLCS